MIEERITSQNISVARKADAPGRVPRSMENPDRLVSNFQRVAVLDVTVTFRRWCTLESHELTYPTLHRFKRGQIIMVNQKRNVQLGTHRIDTQHVIEMCVSGDDLAGLHFDILDEADDSLGFSARVDDYRRIVGLQNVAVGLQVSNHYRVYLGQFGTRLLNCDL